MGRRRGAVSGRAFALALCIATLHLVGLPSAVAQPNVANACKDIQCFSGVVAACGSCLPTSAPAFCKAPCQASWGGLDTITCLGQAGNSYWLNNVQSLNVKCGLPPIPNAAAAAGAAPDGGLGAVAGAPQATAAGAATPVTQTPITVTSGTGQSLSGTPAPRPTAAALTAAGAASSPVAGAAGGAADLSGSGTAAVGGSVATPGAASASGSIVGATTAAGGSGSGGTAGGNGTAVSSAIAAFGCTMQGTQLNIAVASNCVTSVTQNNQCTQPCQAQFALFAPVCRNTMVQDDFYGKTWQGIFRLCQISASTAGQVIANQQAANLAAGPTVASAATQGVTASSQSDPLILAVSPTASEQGASSSMVLRAAPLLVAATAALLLL